MQPIRKVRSQEGQFISYVNRFDKGDVDIVDAPLSNISPAAVPIHARLSVDSDEVMRLHTTDIKQYLNKNIEFSPQLQLFSKQKGEDDWGLFPDQQHEYTVSEFFETDGNDIIIPMNRRIEDLRARLGNTKLIDNDGYIKNFAHSKRPTRPSTHTFKNTCQVVCVTFLPRRKDVEWKTGAWFQYEIYGQKEIRRKGKSVDYIVAARDTEKLDGTRIVAGVVYRLHSGTIQIESGTNIILHIHD